jgi:nitronate monooxygenase
MAETSFTTLVGCSVPVQQAPMGDISTPELAVAVADRGAVGTVAAFGLPAEKLALRLDDVVARTNGVLAVNFLTDDVDRQAVAAAAERVRVVDFFWSDPRPELVEIAHAAGALVCWQIGSVAEARAAADAGCDLIAVQGEEAGGHVRGTTPLLRLLAEVLDAVDLPVLAAGGIADAPALARVLAAGAAGARIGTRFIATAESGAHAAYKRAIVEARAGSTVITGDFNVCPLCATSPRARVLTSAIEALARVTEDTVGEATLGGRPFEIPRGFGGPPTAGTNGRIDAMALYAGEGIAMIRDIAPAAHVLAELCSL